MMKNKWLIVILLLVLVTWVLFLTNRTTATLVVATASTAWLALYLVFRSVDIADKKRLDARLKEEEQERQRSCVSSRTPSAVFRRSLLPRWTKQRSERRSKPSEVEGKKYLQEAANYRRFFP